jgi:spermidine synthase
VTFFLLAIGFVSMLGQVVILRELLVTFYGIELIYALAIGLWLLWSGSGVFLFRKTRPSINGIALLFFFLCLAFPLDVLFIRSGRIIFSAVPGAYLSFLEQGFILLLSLCPIGISLGLLFQWVARLWAGTERSLAAAYAVESLGGLLGGLASTLFFHWGFQNLALTLVCSLVCLMGPLFHPRLSPFFRWIGAIFFLSLFALFFLAGTLDRKSASWNHPGIIALGDTPYGRISITKLSGQISVYANDVLLFETQGREVETFSHLAALQHPGLLMKRVLVLGGLDGTIQELVKYRPEHLDWVDLNQPGINLILSCLPEEKTRPLLNKPVHLILADPRNFLKTAGRYDLIVLAVEEPVSGQANRFYTKEFFALSALRLAPDGILALRLGNGENLWTPAMQNRLKSIYGALKAIFPEVLILPGETNVLTASFRPLPNNPDPLIERWQKLGLGTQLISPPYIRYLFSNDRFFTIQEKLKTGLAPPNSDLKPICYRHTIVIWLTKFFPSLSTISWLDKGHWISFSGWMWIGGVVLAVLLFFRLWGGSFRRVILAGVAGFLGMIFESVLILYYQVKVGVLYQDIGILLTSFMAGLAIGAPVTEKGLTRKGQLQRKIRYWGFCLLSGFSLLAGTVALMMQIGYEIELKETVLLLAASGFVVAGVFVCAGRSGPRNQEAAVAPVYGADLWGGCLGALLAGVIMVPLWGLPAAVYFTIMLAAFSMILI